MTELITKIIGFIIGFLGILAYITMLTIIILDMCNTNPYKSNWEFFKECFKK